MKGAESSAVDTRLVDSDSEAQSQSVEPWRWDTETYKSCGVYTLQKSKRYRTRSPSPYKTRSPTPQALTAEERI